MHLQQNNLFDVGVKVTRNIAQYPLHHVIYASAKIEVATTNNLGEDTITRNVMDGWMDRCMDRRKDEWTYRRQTNLITKLINNKQTE